MAVMRISAPILAPLPVKDWRSNSSSIDYVSDSLALGLLGVIANLIDQIRSLIEAYA